MKRVIALLFVFCMMAYVINPAIADIAIQPFTISKSAAPEICRILPAPANTQPVPGGTPTTFTLPVVLYGVHVSNTSASTVYLQLHNLAASPTASATPVGASSWAVPATSDRDISVGEEQGMNFTTGVTACCSTVQNTYTASGAVCGIILEYR